MGGLARSDAKNCPAPGERAGHTPAMRYQVTAVHQMDVTVTHGSESFSSFDEFRRFADALEVSDALMDYAGPVVSVDLSPRPDWLPHPYEPRS